MDEAYLAALDALDARSWADAAGNSLPELSSVRRLVARRHS